MPTRSLITQQAVSAIQLERAKELRREMTPVERKLWARLRANRLDGLHFRRQQWIGPYIADFYCHQAGLVIEVDGDIHLRKKDYDQERDQFLQSLGLQVLHFSNGEVIQNIDCVLAAILSESRKVTCAQSNPTEDSPGL